MIEYKENNKVVDEVIDKAYTNKCQFERRQKMTKDT